MKIKVNNNFYDLEKLSDKELQNHLGEWKRISNVKVGCCCIEGDQLPPLEIVLRSQRYYLRGKKLKGGLHSLECRFNRSYSKVLLPPKGIKYNEDYMIVTKIDFQSKSHKENVEYREKGKSPISRTNNPKHHGNRLYWVFQLLLEREQVHIFNPTRKKYVASAIRRAARSTFIGKKLLYDHLAVLGGNFNSSSDKHDLIVAWGNKATHPIIPEEKHKLIPLLCLDTGEFLEYAKISNSNFEKSILMDERNVATGYWLIWKNYFTPPNQNKPRRYVERILFIPAEEHTKIPVESGLENQMVSLLASKTYHFKKPLVSNVTEDFLNLRPDMLVYNKYGKDIIIEVAGLLHDPTYANRLKEKREIYSTYDQYEYIEWNGKDDLSKWANLNLPKNIARVDRVKC
ncbi:hypothetical protein C4A76_18125 [Brevibacillus laterosporus]|uniref:hypothetical protein n=1 Tax=Brevibacillus laterosporus TaxID=1465 RepID=UPI000CE5727B|nr:hypothetical protein [Brevibacillus laterosporus]PPA84153.1 hypothetical protein C4A76_18125 [Brevibacillus laterosporus]